jgi:hypothetical protein
MMSFKWNILAYLYHAADFHKKKELNSAKIRALSDAKKF